MLIILSVYTGRQACRGGIIRRGSLLVPVRAAVAIHRQLLRGRSRFDSSLAGCYRCSVNESGC